MTTDQPSARRRTAVVGSGVAGLTAAWVLRHATDVTLYEAADRLGGHADTHDVTGPSGVGVAVDTGFLVHNRRTYPTLLRLFDELGVRTQESDMSMSVHCDGCGLEYAGAKRLAGLFAQGPRSLRPRYLRMLAEVRRFHRQARAVLAGDEADRPLGEFLRRGGFSTYFTEHFMVPLVAAVWSTAPDRAEAYPARYLFSFLDNHGMLSVTGSPVWRTVTGGSRTYVERVAKELAAVRTSSPVSAVRRSADRVEVTSAGRTESFDAVVLATHPHQALALLADPTPLERELLAAITYTHNPALLHDDVGVLPSARGAAASWNVRIGGCGTTRDARVAHGDAVLVSYDLNRLQRLPTTDRYVVSLNAADRVPADRVLARMDYEHPLYTTESVAAQRRLPEISTGRTAFAGAYHGWGFHEDGAASGVRAAAALGVAW
ncbi:MAG TPA: FAD-dependent oxidoreductase [Mycobacteriales bacterium]